MLKGHPICPSFWYHFLRRDLSDFMNRLTQSLKPQVLNSWWIYSNKLSSWLRSSTMSIGFCSPILTTPYLRYKVQDPALHYPIHFYHLMTHQFCHALSPPLCEVAILSSSASNSMVVFATYCGVLMSTFDLLDGSCSSSLVVGIFAPWVLILPTPNPLAHLPYMEPL